MQVISASLRGPTASRWLFAPVEMNPMIMSCKREIAHSIEMFQFPRICLYSVFRRICLNRREFEKRRSQNTQCRLSRLDASSISNIYVFMIKYQNKVNWL